jgi:hypothetical protein
MVVDDAFESLLHCTTRTAREDLGVLTHNPLRTHTTAAHYTKAAPHTANAARAHTEAASACRVHMHKPHQRAGSFQAR